ENVAGAVQSVGEQTPVMLRSRIGSSGYDDVMVLDGVGRQMTVISHSDPLPGAPTFVPATVSTRPYSGSPVAALSMRTNIDGRPGVMAIHQNQTAPLAMMPLPDPTFVVDDTTDEIVAAACNPALPIAGKCSLREAVLEANAAPGTDTIMVPAGTFT